MIKFIRYKFAWTDWLALGFLLMLIILSLSTFFQAYSASDKCVNVCINRYHEAKLELILLVPLSLISVYTLARRFTWKREKIIKRAE